MVLPREARVNSPVPSPTKGHFAVMDGLRGIAAMAVVVLHSWKNSGMVVNGQLAVDLFFMLSGFVIAYSYDDRLRSGMKAKDFLLRRFIRLYPMILVGAVGGIIIAIIHNKTDPAQAYALKDIATSGLLSIFVLPYLAPHIGDKSFSFNIPLWSMFFEIAANLFYVFCARYLSKRILALIVIAGLIGVVGGGTLSGWGKENFFFGFPRVACGFFGGVLLFKLWRKGFLPKLNGNFFVLAAVLVATFAIPHLVAGWQFLPAFALFAVVIIFAAGAAPSRADRYFAWIGTLSYPVYLLHWLTLYVFTWLGTKAGLVPNDYDVVGVFHLICLPVIAYLAVRFYEAPARNFLTRMLRPSSVPPRALPDVLPTQLPQSGHR
jgi:peptidoglycan/LPS O-acetylase OafA/YrhL